MKRLILGLLLALIGSYAMAVDPPEVDTAEVIRRGNDVAVVGEGPRSGEDEAIRAALAPPEDDSHKWFVTLICRKDCPPCEHLKSDFSKAPELLAFVAAPEESRAWAHLNIYLAEDTTQAKRLAAYKVTSYPALIIQPPLDGSWGPPSTVVFQQSGYDGDAKKLSALMSATVKKYAAKMHNLGYPKQVAKGTKKNKSSLSSEDELFAGGAMQAGVDPPFNPFTPLPQQPQYPSQYPPPAPAPAPAPEPSLPSGLFTSTNLLLLLLFGMEWLKRLSPVTPTKVDDIVLSVLDKIKPFLESLTKK